MNEINITLSRDDLENQVERLEEEGYSEDEARSIYSELQKNIENEVDNRGYDWSQEAIDALTNILISTQLQTEEQVTGEIPEEFDLFKNLATEV